MRRGTAAPAIWDLAVSDLFLQVVPAGLGLRVSLVALVWSCQLLQALVRSCQSLTDAGADKDTDTDQDKCTGTDTGTDPDTNPDTVPGTATHVDTDADTDVDPSVRSAHSSYVGYLKMCTRDKKSLSQGWVEFLHAWKGSAP